MTYVPSKLLWYLQLILEMAGSWGGPPGRLSPTPAFGEDAANRAHQALKRAWLMRRHQTAGFMPSRRLNQRLATVGGGAKQPGTGKVAWWRQRGRQHVSRLRLLNNPGNWLAA